MARTLGRLVISIGATTAAFERQLERAGKAVGDFGKGASRGINRTIDRLDNDLNKFAKNIDRSFSNIGGTINDAINDIKLIGPAIKAAGAGMAAFAAGAAVVPGISIAFDRLTESIEQTRLTAERTGVSFEFFQGLNLAANRAGISIEQLNDSLRQFNTFLQTSNEGAFITAIENLGVSIEEMLALNPEERLRLIAEGLAQIDDVSERAGAAVRIFGESGRDMITILGDGETQLDAFVEQARRLGLAFSEEELARITAARQAFDDVAAAVGALRDRFLIAFAPIFETLFEFWTNAGLTANGVQDSMDFMANAVGNAIGFIDATVEGGFRVWFQFSAIVAQVSAAIVGAFARAVSGVEASVDGLINNLNRAIATVGAAVNGLRLLAGQDRVNVPQIGNVSGGLSGRIRGIQGSIESFAQSQAFTAGEFRGEQGGFLTDFRANQNRIPVPAPPPPFRSGGGGVLPPPPPSGGGGGSRGRGGGLASADSTKEVREKERAVERLVSELANAIEDAQRLEEAFDSQLSSAVDSLEVERFRFELIQQESNRIDQQVELFRNQQQAANLYEETLAELNALQESGLITQNQYAESFERLTQQQESYLSTLAEANALEQQRERFEAIADLTDSLTDQMRELLDAELQLQGVQIEMAAVEQARLAIKQLNVELTEKQSTAILKQATLIDMQRDKVASLEEQYMLLDQTNSILQNSATSLFSDLLDGVGSVGDAFSSFFDNLFNNLLNLSLNTIFGGLFGGGGGGLLGGLFGFQEGGVVPTTGPYLLHSGERVLNPREARASSGSGGNIIINNNARGVSVSARETGNGDREVTINEAVSRAREAVRNDFVRSVGTGYGDYGEAIQSSFQVNRRL